MKRRIVLFLSLLFAMIFSFSTLSYAAEYSLQSWWLIDSGKHLDWDGSSNYMREWYNAVNTWNAYKPGVIRVDTWKTINDVTIQDKGKCDGCTLATTWSYGKMVFYQDEMDTLTSTQRQATITHEIGHALGIDHNKKDTSIMRQGVKNFTALDKIDKEAYDAAYKKH